MNHIRRFQRYLSWDYGVTLVETYDDIKGYVERIFLSMRDDNGPEPHVSEPPGVAALVIRKNRFAQFLSRFRLPCLLL